MIFSEGTPNLLLSRDFVGYMSKEVVKRLIAAEMIETKTPDAVAQQVRMAMAEELGIEDRLNEEVREILNQHSEEMRRTGVSLPKIPVISENRIENGCRQVWRLLILRQSTSCRYSRVLDVASVLNWPHSSFTSMPFMKRRQPSRKYQPDRRNSKLARRHALRRSIGGRGVRGRSGAESVERTGAEESSALWISA